jgi:hypothetical protein
MYLFHLLKLALLAGLTVSLWTVRVAFTARVRRYSGALVATAEAMAFATVFAHSRLRRFAGANWRPTAPVSGPAHWPDSRSTNASPV